MILETNTKIEKIYTEKIITNRKPKCYLVRGANGFLVVN